MPPQTPGPMPAFDPEIQAVWDEIGAPPATIQEARDQAVPVPPELLTADGLFTVEDRALPDLGISLLIIRPVRAQAPTGALYWIHGGGMFAGDNRSGVVGEALVAAREFNLAVVSVEYRLAPEHPHPAPVEDCYAGLVWTAGHAAELNIDAGRIICAGGSAGGGLAAAVTLLARDRGGPALLGQMLLCPMLDDRNDTVSARQVTDTGTWTRSSNETGWTALLGSGEADPYAAPARATDLSGLPPAYIDVGSSEVFRDEDVAYASAIWAAGGAAELHVWSGGFHGYAVLAPGTRVARDTVAARHAWLRRVLEPGGGS
ncbi:alpha/beta hydrolase [Kineosporia succinea]|uniref:Acetyl esterase/lipase n=1 Tax=Kineosporia succinea TaxID=84632 RepID=A0ABT9NX07_9ACTN|nr:alpha/beta hydrolase [Kineosporia succinea]MDP9824961.1 acetyl esterase/lipase [Kineosporia succinea]